MFTGKICMNIEFEITEDGSHTLFVPTLNEHYHSTHGAVQESKHVFIDAAFRQCGKPEVTVLEIGFGTGLNAFLTMLEAEKEGKTVIYTSLEFYPLSITDAEKLNYAQQIDAARKPDFMQLHTSPWSARTKITPQFLLRKEKIDFSRPENFCAETLFDVVYFDAFAPEKQPEMWTQAIFDKIYTLSTPNAIFTTYCAKGAVRRMLQTAGFLVERLPGPPGKREMLRAVKK